MVYPFAGRRWVLLLLTLQAFIFQPAVGQKLPFQNFAVDKGLIQSQVSGITQDSQHHLWIGTFAGLDRFDGTQFHHFKDEELASNSITCLLTARDGRIWCGTLKGLSMYDGRILKNYSIPGIGSSTFFTSITEDNAGVIWALSYAKGLHRIDNEKITQVPLPFPGTVVTCLSRDERGRVLIYFYKQGIFTYTDQGWIKLMTVPAVNGNEFVSCIINRGASYYCFTVLNRIIKFTNGHIDAIQTFDGKPVITGCMDHKGNLWVGTDKGIVLLRGSDLLVLDIYDGRKGLSDNAVLTIYRDVEDNIWVGTDGNGLFRFSAGCFVKFDDSNGLPGNIVMGIANDRKDGVYLGTREKGVNRYSIPDKKMTVLDYSAISRYGINCLGTDSVNNLLIGTMDNHLLRLNGKRFTEIILNKRNPPFINSIIQIREKTWLTTSSGCYWLAGDSVYKIKNIDDLTIGAVQGDGDEVLVGSIDGIYSVRNGVAKKMKGNLEHLDCNSMVSYHGLLLIGTTKGLYCWDRAKDKIYHCGVKQGLADNAVYSVFIDSRSVIWLGTGTGLHQLNIDERDFSFRVKRFSRADGYENAETNLNAIAEDPAGHIWIGTTEGVFVYQPDSTVSKDAHPYIVIQRINSSFLHADSSNTGLLSPWYNLPASPVLPYNKNNISFSVKGILMKDPENVRYAYQLAGYDETFSAAGIQSFFNYQNLEPGNYVFRIKAITASGLESTNIAEYPFSIERPFYKSNWFLLLLTIALILAGIFVQYLFVKSKQRKLRQIDLLRQEEQQKIRQHTSEDFHDEMGNKLTRISLLADILQKKLGQEDKGKNQLLQQIRDNVSELYAGTKDIIWALSPGNDQLSGTLNRICQFGEELFADTGIRFIINGFGSINHSILLPKDYSRNTIMIFKEILHNSLRHSGATKVILDVERKTDRHFSFSIADDGIGFDQGRIGKGGGLSNIQRRAERIGARVQVNTGQEGGTMIIVDLEIPAITETITVKT